MGGARAEVLLSLVVGLLVLSVGAQDVMSDIRALLGIKAALADPQGVLNNWITVSENAPCDWQGVICWAGRVYEIRLQQSNLQGPLSGSSHTMPFMPSLNFKS